LVACSAVATKAKSFAAIGQWARNAPQDALARLGARAVSVSGLLRVPGKTNEITCFADLLAPST
jgi:hypothetical protein